LLASKEIVEVDQSTITPKTGGSILTLKGSVVFNAKPQRTLRL